jgi:hypothetical protein
LSIQKKNETADNYIERFVYGMSGDHVIKVVTSDYPEQTIVLNKRGARMVPRELRDETDQATRPDTPVLPSIPGNPVR